MKINKESRLKRALSGFKLGWKMSTLPEKMQIVHNHPLIRIFRVIGGFCIFIVVTRHSPVFISILIKAPLSIAITIVSFALLHLFYIFVISSYRLKHIHYLFKNNKLEVRNSPLDRVATLSLKLLMCAKYGCVGIAGAGTVITAFTGLDTILELGGHDPFFMQGIADIGKTIFGVENARTEHLKQKQQVQLQQPQPLQQPRVVLVLLNKVKRYFIFIKVKFNNLILSMNIFKSNLTESNSFIFPLILSQLNLSNSADQPIIPVITSYYLAVFILSLISLFSFINVLGYFLSIYLLSRYDIEKKIS
jgi:hypothetical protein